MSINLKAQEPYLSWAKKNGGTKGDFGASIAIDNSGNVYTTGYFNGTADFDPGPGTFNLTAVGNDDIFIQKLDAAGNFAWVKQMGGASRDMGVSINTDNSGNVYITGVFANTVDFDPGPGTFNLTSAGNQDIFIQKLDAMGNLAWSKRIGGTEKDGCLSTTVDNSGNVYITGYFANTVDFDPGPGTFNLTAVGNDDIFIQKLEAAGNFAWVKQMGGAYGDYGISIAVDNSGNVYTTGRFTGTVDFDPGPGTFNLSSGGNIDIFIQKLNTVGNFAWAKQQIVDTNANRVFCMAVDNSGNVYTTGFFRGTVDFDPGPGTFNLSSGGLHDIFIQKLNTAGNFVWAKKTGGTQADIGTSIAVDNSGNVYTAGNFYGTADFDPGPGTFNLTSAGSNDIFIQKIDAMGNFGWAKQIGGADNDLCSSLAIDSSGNIYTTGIFWGLADFHPSAGTYYLTSSGSSDIFIAKYVNKSLYIIKHPVTQTKCTRESITFNTLAGGLAGIKYQWSKNGIIIPGASDSFYTISSASLSDSGNYSCFVFNTTDTVESDTAKLFIKPSPIADFTVNDFVQCLDSNNFIFTNNSSINTGSLDYHWTVDGSIFTDTNLNYTFIQYDTFRIKLIATSDSGCKDSIETDVYVYPLPVAAFVYLNNCIKDTIYFYDKSVVDDPDFIRNWLWNFGQGNSLNQRNSTHIYYDSGNYKVVLYTTTDFGCSDSALEYVKIDNHVSESEIIRTTVENDENILIEWLSPKTGNPKTYSLERSLNGSFYNNLVNLDNKSLNYIDKHVRVDYESYMYRILVTDICNYQSPYSNIGKTILLKLEESEELKSLSWTKYEKWSGGIDRYEVQINDLTSSQFITIAIKPDSIFTFIDSNQNLIGYCYRIIAYSKGNPEIKSISNEVCAQAQLNFWVPNSFTPNGDGLNDLFEIKGTFIIDYQISIYNRWGEKVFESNEIEESWDGLFKDKLCPTGNYYYHITVKGTKAQYESVKGMILLLK